jgi:hypothetical protein
VLGAKFLLIDKIEGGDLGSNFAYRRFAASQRHDAEAAEKLFFPGDSDDDYGDSVDVAMVRNYLQPRTELQRTQEIGRFRLAARRLVALSRREIESVADALMQRGTLSGNEIVELLGGSTMTTAAWVT